jgi:hypothetical protein
MTFIIAAAIDHLSFNLTRGGGVPLKLDGEIIR